ncbi:MAG: uracil-DNA glycosylase [Rhodospirillaceae bacterium]|nr:uracil-DNA glycosylase [Rhodospirillaceae bacterium]MBT5567184.1 uracil-DNA glycosylase [Rhodospirillaceae bacterium]MBT6089397.1 uracil-DNA glycosylase [Rhodospirillaceae bacterium]MBT6962123.1 uracil-DNA glycosylase [Rhodospirillaceae bacterium]
MAHNPVDPPLDCDKCPRLVEFRKANQAAHPDWFNAPVPAFGPSDCTLLIVGLAPGLQGANRTGRPFTGDYAGDLLYPTLIKFGWATGTYGQSPDDGLKMNNCRITNAVRCVPPQNKPIGAEQKSCRTYLVDEFENLPKLKTILALGRIGHDAVVTTLDLKKADYPFSHAARHTLPDGRILTDSYHCSRYNLNTRRLTPDMFETVFKAIT